MTPPVMMFRCPVCRQEVKIPLAEFEQVPICEADRRIMQLVGGVGGEVNQGVQEVMTGLTRLAVAALTNTPGTGPLEKDQHQQQDQG